MTRLELPYPPSMNSYWRNTTDRRGRPRTLLSKDARAYRAEVTARVWEAGRPKHGKSRLRVSIGIHPPDRRRRDIDNLTKSLLDSLEHAGVFDDDEQVDELTIRRLEVKPEGAAVVLITPLEEA